ncbi:(S)-ureidoglycine aminohydrolase [Tindallia magadiensis]|uniref:(S)-ureidoglycine aminohydrolase n=1 Tax=Tindallia magadiensis TaxID=69895 RepID=A0A1I3H1X3_9FIRM|nr:(S)-ureidoglycine aminohydrolase [Tindallia magadiensis]SFI29560.1 (S)-ureidoglycine aminohydrolase [Tindallia magadiensis]
MSYPKDLLSSRAIVRPGKFALIPPEGLVNNVIPGFENCQVSILTSPKIGASFAHYLVTMEKGGNVAGFGEEGVESFVYCIKGDVEAGTEDEKYQLTTGGYLYCPPDKKMFLQNKGDQSTQLVLYKQKFVPLDGTKKPWTVAGNVNEMEERLYEDMHNVTILDLLPTDLAFDMNMHILTFDPPGSHPFVETHVQEHGAYLLSGEGIYNLDNEWIPVKKNDYIWFGPFVPQAVYAVGKEKLSYVYSKDCNRDVVL